MVDKKPDSFSVVQVVAAWFVGFALACGAIGVAAFHSPPGALFVFPLLIGAVATLASIVVYVIGHWEDHD